MSNIATSVADRALDPQTGEPVITPTEYLMLEVLAARARLGETHWTFPTSLRPTARALEALGLVGWKSGIVEKTILVWFSPQGREAWLSPTYTAGGS